MLWTFLAIVGVVAGAFGIAGAIKGSVDAAKYNRSLKNTEKDSEVEDEENLEEEKDLEEDLDKEEEKDLEEEEEKKESKNLDYTKWLEKNKISQDSLEELITQKIREICGTHKFSSPEMEKLCKDNMSKLAVNHWNKVIETVEKSKKVPNIDNVNDYILTGSVVEGLMTNSFAKHVEYEELLSKVEGSKEIKKDLKVYEYAREQLKILKRDLTNSKVSSISYKNKLDQLSVDLGFKVDHSHKHEKIDKNIQKALATAMSNLKKINTIEGKVAELSNVVESHSYDLKMLGYLDLANISEELTKLKETLYKNDKTLYDLIRENKETSDNQNVELIKKIEEMEKEVNETINEKISELSKVVESHSYDLKMLGYLDLANISEELAKLKETLYKNDKTLYDLIKENKDDLNKKNAELINKIESLEVEVNKTINEKIKEIAAKLGAKANSASVTAKLKKIEDALAGKCSTEQLNEINKVLKELKESAVSKKDFEGYKTELDLIKKDIQETKSKITLSDEVQEKLKALEDIVSELKEDYVTKEELNRLHDVIKEIKAKTNKEIKSLNGKLTTVQKNIKELKEKVKASGKDNETLRKELEKLQTKQEEINLLKQKITEIEKQISKIASKEYVSKEEIHELQKIMIKETIKESVKEVIEKVTVKVEKLDAKAKKQLIKEIMEKVEEQIKANETEVDIDKIADEVISKLTISKK